MIVNARARDAARAELDGGLDLLRGAGMHVELLESEGPRHSREAVLARHQDLDLVIVAGGDGTISSMAGTLVECGLTLAIVPLGTANDLARSLSMPTPLPEVFSVISECRSEAIDLGRVNGTYFFNVAHMGLGVKVTRELSDETKRHWGVLGYLKALLAAMARVRQFRVKLVVDGRQHQSRSIQLAVGNGPFYGGGNLIDDGTHITDGALTLYSLRPQSTFDLLTLAPLIRSGRQRHDDRSFTARGQQILVETRPRRMSIHADGEPAGWTPARFDIQRGALRVLVPASFKTRNSRLQEG
jgi:YegS/Rv2252/BmrU family lipid kinase